MLSQIPTIVALVVGGIAGWLVARIMKRGFLGEILYVVVGAAGGLAGAWIGNFLQLTADSSVHSAIAAAVGSVVLLLVWRLALR
jgi:uncharacterized membrane protein YeaQ/YmgE (transglycosylase-associated protein family)